MEVKDATFEDVKELNSEGIVFLACGGELDEWVDGVSESMEEDCSETGVPEELWSEILKLETTGGRIDLVFMFKEDNPIDMGRLAIARLEMSAGGLSNSWLSDYVVNYEDHHVSTEVE